MVTKLRRFLSEKVILAISAIVFPITITILILGSFTHQYYYAAFPVMFIALLGIFVTGIPMLFKQWYQTQIDKESQDFDTALKKFTFRFLYTLIVYYIISIITLNTHFSGIYSTFASDLVSYRMGYILWFIYLVIPICYILISYYNYCLFNNPFLRQVKKLERLLDTISNGNLSTENPFQEEERFYHYGEALVNYGKMTSKAISDSIQDEKMKVELITNVSHDLKTPLTSMIGYIDLMKKEELPDLIKDYVYGLSEKAEKLKEMIQSLFDLAKTASGNVELTMETIDMNRLIQQILADMDDVIQSNHKVIKLSLTKNSTEYMADSSSMYRVCQNLIDNAIKYSLKDTRIIITTTADQYEVVLTIKNIANYEMNVTQEEIVERFTRADKARSTDGNGLGLAIAKTYTGACHGQFNVTIDDDVFIAQVRFSK